MRIRRSETSRPIIPIQTPILHRLRQVFGADYLGMIEIGDGARDFQNTVVGAGA